MSVFFTDMTAVTRTPGSQLPVPPETPRSLQSSECYLHSEEMESPLKRKTSGFLRKPDIKLLKLDPAPATTDYTIQMYHFYFYLIIKCMQSKDYDSV
jgi:hypothetical protein